MNLEKAKQFAEKYHGSQMYGSLPYTYHLEQVVKILETLTNDHDRLAFNLENLLIAGWLHDILEDTKCTKQILEQEFGADIAELVWKVTGVGRTRKLRNVSIYKKCQDDYFATTLKVADHIANVEHSKTSSQELFDMYKREFFNFARNLKSNGAEFLWRRLCSNFGISYNDLIK